MVHRGKTPLHHHSVIIEKSLVQSNVKENSQEASADPAPTDRRVIRDDHPATELPGGLRAKGNPQAPQGGCEVQTSLQGMVLNRPSVARIETTLLSKINQRQTGQQANSDKQQRNDTSSREQAPDNFCVSNEHMPTYCLQFVNPYKLFKTFLRPKYDCWLCSLFLGLYGPIKWGFANTDTVVGDAYVFYLNFLKYL